MVVATVTIRGTLTVEPERGVVRFHGENGKLILELKGPVPDPENIQVDLDLSPRRKLNRFDKDKIIGMAQRKMPVLKIAKILMIDGRKVSGIIAHARRYGILPRPGPKEWSPRGRYPRIR